MGDTRDRELARQVRARLKQDKNLKGYAINADVVEGEAQLQGIVDTLKEKELAAKLVREVPGIKGVANAISISTDGAIQARDVSMEVQEELEQAPGVVLRHIGASSPGGHGTVVLKGDTGNPREIEAARSAAARARGVTRVINQVKLNDKKPGLEELFHSQVNNDRE